MNSPGIQSLMQQITSNPEMMRTMMSPENMQMMQRMMSQNPGLMQQVPASSLHICYFETLSR